MKPADPLPYRTTDADRSSATAIKMWRVGARLAECPVWLADQEALAWVDVLRPSLNLLDLRTGRSQDVPLPAKVGSASPYTNGDFLIAMATGLFRLRRDGQLVPCPSPDMRGIHFNDGKCDARGRFWVGTRSSDGLTCRGSLFRRDKDGAVVLMDDGFDVPNGLGWSPDGRSFYLIDTGPRILYRYDFAEERGEISNRSILRTFDGATGKPDGLAIDTLGNIWCAMWDGGGLRVLTADGEDRGWVDTPCVRPTSCAFGGKDNSVLFVTSASTGPLAFAAGDRKDDSGVILAFETGIVGMSVPRLSA